MEALGIDVKLFLGQIVNFVILLVILWLVLYKPIVKLLNTRREKIAKSLENAKAIEDNLAKCNEQTSEMIKKAQSESAEILENAKKIANQNKDEILALAKNQAEKEIAKAKSAIQAERDEASRTLRKEVAALVGLATTKILEKQPAQDTQEKAIEEAIMEMEKSR